MEAIGIIEREHRNFMAVLKCLENAVNDVAWRDREPDFPLIHSILDYVETFMDRYHHHNERDLLFNALDRRCPDAGELLQQMDVEHRDGTMLLGEFKAALDTYEKENHEAFEAFQDAVYKYIGFERTHCQKEEHRVIPLVREHLTAFDWVKIDAAFSSHKDPLFGEQARSSFKRLHNQIVELIASQGDKPA